MGELKKLPIYTLYEMHKNITPIMAKADLRFIRCINTIMNDKADEIIKVITNESPSIAEIEEVEHGFDRKGFNMLKAKITGRKG